MRLTLRTLLAYLDDQMDAADIKQFGQRVAESDAAQELIARIRQITRRRRLTTPPATGPGAFDPNTVAEYLDNVLPPDQVADLEKTCLDSDVHLAELAGCHQILTLVLGQPAALVPPTAKERMYELVHGREAVARRAPNRRASRGNAAEEWEDEDEGLLTPPGYRKSRPWLRWALPLAGLFLLVAVGFGLLYSLPSNRPRPTVASNNRDHQDKNGAQQVKPPPTNGKENVADHPKEKEKEKPKPAGLKLEAPELVDVEAGDRKTFPLKVSRDNFKGDVKVSFTGALIEPVIIPADKSEARAEVNVEKDAKAGPTEVVARAEGGGAKAETKIKLSVKPPAVARKRPDPPSKEHTRVGRYEAPMRGTAPILLQKRSDGWKRVDTGGVVFTAEPLVSLPGFTSELRLDSRVLLSLRGNMPEFAVHPLMNYLLESAVILHQTTEFDADLTLLRGRIYIASAKPSEQGPTRVRVRFSGEVWDLTFSDPATEIGIDLLRQYTSDLNWRTGEEPRTEAYLFVLKGKAQLTQNTYHVHKLEAPPKEAAFEWDNMDGTEAKPREVKELPATMVKDLPLLGWKKLQRDLQEQLAKLPADKARELENGLAGLAQSISAAEKTLAAMKQLSTEMIGSKPVSVALMEATGLSQEFPLRELAIFSLAAIDEVGKLFDVLSNEARTANPDRYTAIFALRGWLGRGPEQGKLLYDPKDKTGLLRDGQRFNATEAETLLILLHDFSPKDSRSKETFEYLVRSLHNNKLAIRQLAYWHLLRLSQGLREFPPYDPTAQEAARDMMAQKWEKLVEDGQLPPKLNLGPAQPMPKS